MESKKAVVVLMSTYNGEQYIGQQIDSILAQQEVDVTLLIRDDGSTDTTQQILERYAKQYDKISWYTGDNLRSAKSFMDLLANAPTSEFYAFADQDDVWDQDKLIIAINKLQEGNDLYCCKKRIVDQQLNELPQSDEYVRDVSLGASILKCPVSGCTMVFTHRLKQYIDRYMPEVLSMHDAWVLKVAGCIGKVFYDEVPHMDYRQHDHNVVGATQSGMQLMKYRLKTFLNRKHDLERVQMAKQLYEQYGQFLTTEDRQQLKYFAFSREKISYRFKAIVSNFLTTQQPKDIIFIKLFIMLGII